jgi:hypothetical protein
MVCVPPLTTVTVIGIMMVTDVMREIAIFTVQATSYGRAASLKRLHHLRIVIQGWGILAVPGSAAMMAATAGMAAMTLAVVKTQNASVPETVMLVLIIALEAVFQLSAHPQALGLTVTVMVVMVIVLLIYLTALPALLMHSALTLTAPLLRRFAVAN